jgi:hypothetical protein
LQDELLLFVADNPEIIRFAVSCAGVKPQLEVDKHLIQFDRLLLQRDLQQSFTIKNIYSDYFILFLFLFFIPFFILFLFLFLLLLFYIYFIFILYLFYIYFIFILFYIYFILFYF